MMTEVSASTSTPPRAIRTDSERHLARATRWFGWSFVVLASAALALALLFPGLVASSDAWKPSLGERLKPPFWAEGGTTAHLLGTDAVGRDLFAGLVYGARISVGVSLATVLFSTIVGGVLGLIAGYFGGAVDMVIMRFVDSMITIPIILIALVIAISLGPGFLGVVLSISLVLWTRFARLIRGDVLALRQHEYVRAAEIAGARGVYVIVHHVVPNVMATAIVVATLHLGSVVIAEASLSFLGVGVPPDQPSWGNIMAAGRNYTTTAWWITFLPGLAIAITVLVVTVLGDRWRDHLDPSRR